MQFTTIILLLLSTAYGLMAFPSAQPNAANGELHRNETSHGSSIYPYATSSDGSSTYPNTTYVELYREKTSNGSLVYLGLPQDSNIVPKDVPGLEKRASCTASQAITCGDDNAARNNLCDQLVTELFGDSSVAVGSTPRQVCFEADDANNFCCVSWSVVIPNLIKGDLATPANSMQQ